MNFMSTGNTIAGLAALVIGGCATTPAIPPAKAQQAEAAAEECVVDGRKIPDWVQPYTPIERVLKYVSAGEEGSAPGVKFGYGYIWNDFADTSLIIAGGLYTNTVTVVPNNEGGYKATGNFSRLQHPEIMKRVLLEADTDNDRFVSTDEALTLSNKLATQKIEQNTAP